MEISLGNSGLYTVTMTRDELGGLCNCIGEVFETLDEWEIPTRVGLDIEELRECQTEILRTLRTE